mgnify:CR=1 FL=1
MAKVMTIRAPDDVQKTLKKQALKLGYTRNALILQILREWMEQHKDRA